MITNLREFRDGKEIDKKWFNIYNIYMESPEWKDKLESAIKGLNYKAVTEKINEENVKKLYGDTLKTSVSKLEQYSGCPFSYYLKIWFEIK